MIGYNESLKNTNITVFLDDGKIEGHERLCRVTLKTPTEYGWWVQHEDGRGFHVGASDLNWKLWKFQKDKE